MTRSAVTYKLSGRLGNHLQLWACARTLSLRYGWDFLYQPIVHGEEFHLPYERRRVPLLGRTRLRGHDWDGQTETGRVLPSLLERPAKATFVLEWSGVFPRVDEFRPQLLAELLGDHDTAVPVESDPQRVGVHIRRTDAAYPLPIDYYVDAVHRCDVSAVTVFSDGAVDELAADLRRRLDVEVTPRRGAPVEDLLALAGHGTIVMSASWFSFWAAFLSHDARVLVPAKFQYYPSWEPV